LEDIMASEKTGAKASESNVSEVKAPENVKPVGATLVKMAREADGKTADVHPNEVKNYALADYRVVKSDK
jgi:hypothetical protein